MESQSTKSNERQIFLFLLWEASRGMETEVLKDISEHFTILKQFEVAWPQPDFIRHLQAFYGHGSQVWISKARRNGTGNFRVVIVEDHAAVYDYRDNLRGQQELVDLNIYNAKKRYRSWIKSKDKIHSSVNLRETRHNLAMLLDQTLEEFLKRSDLDGSVETIVTQPPPDKGWRDFPHLFKILNECMPYVVLRNAEPLRDPTLKTDHGDVDILVGDVDELVSMTGAVKMSSKPTHSGYRVPVGSSVATLDVRVVGDGYYDPKWAKQILANSQVVDGIRVPSPEDQFFSLLYHALIQKKSISPDYAAYFKAHAADFSLEGDPEDLPTLRKWLASYMKAHGFVYFKPYNPKVGFYPENQLPGVGTKSLPKDRKHLINVAIGLNKFKLHLFTGVNMPNILRIQIRLGGIFKIDFCLGDIKEIGI